MVYAGEKVECYYRNTCVKCVSGNESLPSHFVHHVDTGNDTQCFTDGYFNILCL